MDLATVSEPDLGSMSDRELLLDLHRRFDKYEKRLTRVEANQTLHVVWAREIALARGADQVARDIDAYLERQADEGG